MSNVTRTIYSSALQSAQLLGIPYEVVKNTTLNEKFTIAEDQELPDGAYPVAKYLAIGRGGHRNITGADNASLTTLNTHRPSDAALFQHLPFVLREITDDLDPVERGKYGLRREEWHDNIQYVAYYLRRLDYKEITTDLNRVIVENGNNTNVPYIPSSADLNPTPLIIEPDEVTETSGEYLTASTIISITLNEGDVAEIVRAANIIHGSELYATVSEIAVCTGLDFITTAQNGEDAVFNYVEAQNVQVAAHICTHHPLHELNNGVDLSYEIGGSESLTLPIT